MRRKRGGEEHENLERWLVSYADFITLLFAFFVIMYAVSSVNEGKYRVLSDALVAAFRSQPMAIQPIQVGSSARAPFDVPAQLRQAPVAVEMSKVVLNVPKDPSPSAANEAPAQPSPPESRPLDPRLDAMIRGSGIDEAHIESAAQVIREMATRVEQAMESLIHEDLIAVRRNRLWIEVEIRTSLLFPSGSARLSPQAVPVLGQLAEILRPLPNRIHVEGFTDNVPINTLAFPSNWELSAARAASVVHLFTRYGVDPERMVAIGYGEHRPIAENDTEEGRVKNRRVVLVVLAGSKARLAADAVQPELLREDLEPATQTAVDSLR